MLSRTRHRVIPASLFAVVAMSASVLGAATPAQAAIDPTTSTTVSTTLTPTTVDTTSVATTSVLAPGSVSAAVLTPTQLALAAAARAAAAHLAATRVAAAARAAAAARVAARVARIRTSAVHVARGRIGSRYVAGRSGPTKFDCSGLSLYVVRKATGRTLPHYSKAQYRATKRVSRSHLRAGDLVFFFRHGAHHVGIYIGNGRMVSATNPRSGVRIDRVFSGWYGARYSGAGRLV